MREQKVIIQRKLGIHARPSHAIARVANRYESTITLICEGEKADAKSSFELQVLAMGPGKEVSIVVVGDDEENALPDMVEVLSADDNFPGDN